MPDNQPATPVPAATIMMLRERDEGLEVFMVVRHHQIDFASGALVFPGGKADEQDFAEDLAPYLQGAADERDLRAIQVCAIREAFEECGILLAYGPDGSFIANLDGRGVVRVSRCGEILWRNQGRAHHSIDVDETGRIWTPVLTDRVLAQSVAAVPVRFDAIAAFDPDTGETLVHIDLLQMIVEAGYEGLVTPNRMDLDDVLHVNDVEILDSDIAGDFPLFEAGDIMVNPRNPNQVWILDGRTHKLKWWMTTPAKGARSW